MASEPYQGPVLLGASKYATPQRSVANSGSSPAPDPAFTASGNAIATKQEVAATASTKEPASPMTKEANPDAQLAMAQNLALKYDVNKHAAQFSRSVSTAVENTHRLLNLIRDSIKNDGPAAEMELRTVDNLWMELKDLFKAANEANAALPEFMSKHEDNMSLYHNSMMNEILRDSQEELKLQHKKVNIQHSLTLEHQQAFQDYKARTESKLAKLSELNDRVERLQMEQGLFKDEINTYKKLLNEAKVSRDKTVQTVHDLQKELSASQTSNNGLTTDNKALGATIKQLEESLKTAERRVTETQNSLTQKSEALTKATHEQASLRITHMNLQSSHAAIQKESEDLKAEGKKLQEKFKNQGSEYSKLFAQSNTMEGHTHALEGEVAALKQYNQNLKHELAAQIKNLTGEKHAVEKEVTALEAQVDTLDKKNSAAKKEVELLEGEIAAHKKAAVSLDVLKEENTKLRATIEELQKKPVVTATASADEGALKGLQEQLRQSAEKTTSLEASVEEWAELATRSYAEYKQMLPTYKNAETYRKDCLEKDKEITDLKSELQTAKAAKQTNGTGANQGNDAVYWKDKYESLLAKVSN